MAVFDNDQQGCLFQSIAELRTDVDIEMDVVHAERKLVQRIIDKIRLERQVF